MMLSPNRQSRAGGFMREIFTIGFSEDEFAAAVAGELATPGITPLAAASRFFGGSLLDSLTRTMGQRLIKHPTVSKVAGAV